MNNQFQLACPICRGNVRAKGENAFCENREHTFQRVDDIWRFLPRRRAERYANFLEQYHALRRDDGWGSSCADYYRALPHVPRNDLQRHIWRIREKNFRRLLEFIGNDKSLRILDIGAGNGWLSNQLTQRGHMVAALDISDDERDGLGARENYLTQPECYQGEFDNMPFCAAQFDLAIFNASLHYSSALTTTLDEAKRVIDRRGKIAVMDSPFYSDDASGKRFVYEQHSRWGSHNLGMAGFLTMARLADAASAAGLQVSVWAGDQEWHKQLRRKFAKRKLSREPAHFPILVLS